MSTFTGTSQEFKRYIGPRLRNLVQMITRSHKANVGSCQHCGVSENLESAHVKGKGRDQIIDRLLAAISTESVVTIDLQQFESIFKFEHDPVEKAILILCRQCHKIYDAEFDQKTINAPDVSHMAGSVYANQELKAARSLLPIALEPSSSVEFKRQLVKYKRAQITIFYKDGQIEHRAWDASNFSETSNVMGNLRSRAEFKQGKWQGRGIVKVHVRVVPQDV